ncbi:UDP-N-acetylglucosamine 2-epimerase [Paucibacter sp. M5-1]|uniref:UDP-N-acetylglucosamine 2-epimerase n=1 Tax=Paucibacter sp. M5-1 TaxID=3015998 RepID=UPI0022B861B3|nr:UDP-N-acetylglucosamine 2-epimerase [Paucibacter sp. M5-1]MCZ7879629.1 UDP-N-acetylglucosamine 2-epimerase [Paucibacter sp. M5-1]
MKRILGLTSIRSDYDLMSGVYRALHNDPAVDLRLLVSGAHLSPQFGRTVDLIVADGFALLGDVESLISGDSKSSRLKTAANLLNGAIDLVRAYAPDLMIFAGDREDVLVAATIGAFLDIPTVHFFGGDHAADGHVDNPVRHATSKLSTAHFVSIDEHRRRLLSLGESDRRIVVIGSVALDKFASEPPLSKEAVLQDMQAKPHAAEHPLAVLIFHPVDQERARAPSFVRDAVNAMVERGYHVMVGAPNPDPGNNDLVEALRELGQLDQVTYYGNTSRANFVNLMRHASLMIGNSSAGLLEAASVRLPVINIGERQRGRTCGANVLFCDGDRTAIELALDTVRGEAFTAILSGLINPYGDGRSASKAAELLKSTDFRALIKKTEDPIHACQ